LRWRYVVAPLSIAAVAYAAVVLSGFPHELARTHPERASWLRPPLFNLAEEYHSGTAVGFSVGEPAESVERSLIASGSRAFELNALCGDDSGRKSLPINEMWLVASKTPRLHELLGRSTVCLFAMDDRLVVELSMAAGKVRAIRVFYIRTDVIA
jgi:hypothetical protein